MRMRTVSTTAYIKQRCMLRLHKITMGTNLAFVLALCYVALSKTTPLPSGFVKESSHGIEFYVGVIVELNQPPHPSIFVSNDGTEAVNFTLLIRDPRYELNATVENGSVVSIPLPEPSLSSLIDSDRALMGVNIKAHQPSIRVFLSPEPSDIFPAFPCERLERKRGNHVQYSYHMFPAALTEQPLTRSRLLLVGCQDATSIQVLSTDMLTLPVSVNATTTHPISPSNSVTTSFVMDQLNPVTFLLTGDVSKTYVLSNKPITVTLVTTADCITPTSFTSAPCGNSYTQISPSLTWGRVFLVSSQPGSGPGAKYVIQTGTSTSTSVSITCSNSTHTDIHSVLRELSLEQLSRFTLKVAYRHHCSIESQNPIQVVQYGLREPTGINTTFPLLILPIEQYGIVNSAILPLLTSTEDDAVDNGREFRFFATVLVPVVGQEDSSTERKKVLVDGEPVSGDWNEVFCHNTKLCGYVTDIPLPLQSSVNISHETLDVAFNVVIHRDGFSFSPGSRLIDLSAPIVYIERASYTALEEDMQVELTVVRDGNHSEETVVLFTTRSGTALGGEDYVDLNNTLTFQPGDRTKVITITLLNDFLLEENETFHVSITADNDRVTVARTNATVIIKDTDALEVGFERESYRVDEVTGRLEVNITSSTPFPGPMEVVLTMTTYDGTAEAPDDYFPLNIFLLFTPGVQSITVTLHAFEDLIVEPELEWFSLALGVLIVPAGRVIFTRPNATVFIEDSNTLQLELVPSSIMAAEDGEEGSEVTVIVSSTGQTVRPVIVSLVTFDLTATAGEDYEPVNVTLTFTEATTSFAVVLEVLGDSVVEGDEVLVAGIVVPEGENGVSLKSSRVEISIIDDDSVLVMFSMSEVAVSEAGGVVDLTVIKTGANSKDVFVTFSTLDGNAVEGEDYTSTSGTLTFSGGDSSLRLEVAIRDDAVVEYSERFIVVLSAPETESGVRLAEPRRVVVTITNDDMVKVGFSEVVYTVSEGDGEIQFTITKSGVNARDVGVTFATEQNSATSPDDFSGKAEIVMFSSGNTTTLGVSVSVADDTRAEGIERFSVALLPATEGGVSLSAGRDRATVVIIDNDHVVVGFSQSVYMAVEGEMSISIGLSRRGITSLPVTVVYSTQDNTSTADEDYVSLTNVSITFSGMSGEPPVIQLRLRDDEFPERTEQLILHLTLPPLLNFDLRLADNPSATVIILDNDDVTVRFEPEVYRVSESSGSVVVRLVLLGETSNTVAVTLRTADNEAIAPGDYFPLMLSLVFRAGEKEKSVAVPLVEDRVLEDPESFSLDLSPLSTGVVVPDTPATVFIEDNDVLSVGFEATAVQTSEDIGVVEVRVELNGTTEVPVTVLFTYNDDTAAVGEDYSIHSETLLFAPGESSTTLSVGVTSDSVVEFTERFLLVLSSTNDSRVVIDSGRRETEVEIQDTSVVRVWFQNVTVETREGEGSSVILSLRVSGELQRAVSVEINTRDATATAGADYVKERLQLIIPAGENELVFEIDVLDDSVVEGDEYFSVYLTTEDVSLTVTTPTANVTILEDDTITVTFERTSYTVDESEDHVVVTVMMVENNTLIDVPVIFSTIDDTAIGNSIVADYVGVEELVLTFGPSQSEHNIQISIMDDPALESTESFRLRLSTPLHGAERVSFIQSQATVTILDNDEVSLEFGQRSFFAIEGEPVVFLTVRRVGISYIDIPFTVSTHPTTATADVDYVSSVPVVVLQSFQQRQFVPITILDDQIVEGDELFSVALQILPNTRGVRLIPAPATISILENDFLLVMFEPAMYTVGEEAGQVTLTLSVEGDSVINHSIVIYTTSDTNSTAQAGEDFNKTVTIVEIRPNDTLITVTIPIVNDAIDEGVEIFSVATSSMSEFLLIENPVAIVQIIDRNDEADLRVGWESIKYTASEREESVEICLTASSPVPDTLSFLVYTEGQTAEEDVDYVSVRREVQLSPGQQRRCVSINIVDDRVSERTEDLLVFVESDLMNELVIEGLSIAPAVTDVVIIDNDRVTIEFEEGEVSTDEGSGVVVVKVVQIGSSAEPVTVAFTTEEEGSAESGVDYDPLRGVLVFSTLDSEKEIAISVNDDGILEGQEYFSVMLSLPMSSDDGVALGRQRIRVNINDDDVVVVEFETGAYTVVEDDESLTVCVTKDRTTVFPIILLITPMESSPPSATEGRDFQSGPVTITLPASATTSCTELSVIIDDTIYENSQRFDLGMNVVSSQPYISLGSIDRAVVTILDNDVIQIFGANKTVAESAGGVEVCLEMDRVAEIPVSLHVTFSRNADPLMTPAQGGVDFDSTPRNLVFEAGETRACIDVDIFPDSIDEQTEHFTVVVTSFSDNILPPVDGGPVITITDDQGGVPVTPTCKALDSIVIEPFPSPSAVLDSFTFHSPCEHVLLTTCGDQSNSQHSLRVVINFSPSNLDLLGLAVNINRTRIIKVLRNSMSALTNFSNPISFNRTHSLYSGGVLIVQRDYSTSIVLQYLGLEITRSFGLDNRVEVRMLEETWSTAGLCGLCGTVDGRLMYSDGVTEAASIDSLQTEDFASSWRVSPQEVLLGQQGEECGTLRNDSIIGDPLFTVPLNFPSMTPDTPRLCFEVHGARDRVFNLISDRCTSVNALFTAMPPPLSGNIINTVGITTVDHRGNCVEIEVSLETQCVPVIRGADGIVSSSSRYSLNGVSVRRHQQGVRVAVPNCENAPLVLWILCQENRNTSMIKFVISRGVNLRPTSHGLLGQFWNIPITVSPMTTTIPAPLTLDSLPPPYVLTLSPPMSRPRQFIARLYSNTWDKRGKQCYYAGSAQGGPLGDIESPHLRDSVIEGRYTDYIVDSLFDSEFLYTQFDSRECITER